MLSGKPKSFTDIIMTVWLPGALRYNIPYETFWTLNPKILQIYQDVHVAKMKEQMQIVNYTAWLQGQYNIASIGAAMSKNAKYPKKPLALEQQDSGMSGEEKFKLWIQEFNKRFE